MRTVIRGGRILDPSTGMDGLLDLLVSEGRIAAILPPGTEVPGPVRLINAKGLCVAPGFVDIHVHLREPGFEYKETIGTGTMAAAAGGFVAVACMPNTEPVNDNGSVTSFILEKAKTEGKVRVLPVGAISKGLKGESLAEMGEMAGSGARAFSDDGMPVMNANLMRRAMEYARGLGLPIISHCEDLNLSKDGLMNEGFISTQLGLRGIPSASEEVMVARDVCLARLTKGRVHITHVSSKGSVEIIRRAKEEGLLVTADVTPHHLLLVEEDLISYDTNLKVKPPLRSREDREALFSALKEGVIDAIATDHAPQSAVEKDMEFEAAENGVIGLETAFGACAELVRSRHLSLMELISRLSLIPAKIIGDTGGTLREGAAADIALFSPDEEWEVRPEEFFSRSRNTPFAGRRFRGRVKMTMVHGKLVFGSMETVDER